MSAELWVSWRQWAADQITIHMLHTRLDHLSRRIDDQVGEQSRLSSRVAALEERFTESSQQRGRGVIWRELRYWGALGLGLLLLAALITWNIDKQLSLKLLDIAGKLALALL